MIAAIIVTASFFAHCAPAAPADTGTNALDVIAADALDDLALDAPRTDTNEPGDTPRFDVNHDAAPCTSTFGRSLTMAYGRIDGTLYSVVRPVDQQCAQPNRNHLDLEVAMLGGIYRMLITVIDTRVAADVLTAELDAPLLGPPFLEGWHTMDVALDYVTGLHVSSTAFVGYPAGALVTRVLDQVSFGDPIAIFASGYGPDGAHNIHRNDNAPGIDGAVVIRPTSATPHYLLFRFANQQF
jgi:hypothetical protein